MSVMLKLMDFAMYPRTTIDGEYQTAEEEHPSLYVPETSPLKGAGSGKHHREHVVHSNSGVSSS